MNMSIGSAPGFSCDASGTCTYTPLEPLSPAQSGTLSMADFVKELFRILFSISGLIAVVALTAGGIQYMVSEVPGVKAASLDRIKASMYGILILIGSYMLLYTINPQLLEFRLGSLNQPSSGSAGSGGTDAGGDGQSGGAEESLRYTTYTAASEGGQRYAQGSGQVLVDTKDYGAIMFSDAGDLTKTEYIQRNKNFFLECKDAAAEATITMVESIAQVANVCAQPKQ
jgi:hypothetical protein